MSTASLTKLAGLSGEPLAAPTNGRNLERFRIPEALRELLLLKNGFYAFGGALLMRPLSSSAAPLGIVEWNKPETWKDAFPQDLRDCLFFAEDVFGHPFGMKDEQVVWLNPETGESANLAHDPAQWASKLLRQPDYFTGYSLVNEWQRTSGALPRGSRLVPKQPFIVGGSYSVQNLKPCEEVRGMKIRGMWASKLSRVPDGQQFFIRWTE